VPDLRLFRETWKLRAWAYWKIRLIAYVRPTVVEWTEERCEIRVPLTRRTRNHLKSMYFGALWTGADAVAAMIGLKASQKTGGRIAVIFKDARAEFLKRPEADVHFTCAQGRQILELMEKADSTGERQNLPVEVVATVPTLWGGEPVARFTLTLSVKKKS
jgi:acyl-coenzyme A thioesterase PaaI-like protein